MVAMIISVVIVDNHNSDEKDRQNHSVVATLSSVIVASLAVVL